MRWVGSKKRLMLALTPIVIASVAQQSHENGAAEQMRLLRCARKDRRLLLVLVEAF